MSDLYTKIDNSVLLNFLFYPRRQHSKPSDGAFDLAVPVTDDISIVCRAYPGAAEKPWILYFHGNGEVVSDYDGIAHLYRKRGLNLLVADYRGYGASGGKPTFTALVSDVCIILDYVLKEIIAKEDSSGLFVMGRSLGSIAALELASRYAGSIQGLIIESGFISVAGLIHHLGLPSPGDLSPLENSYRELCANIKLPALVIHGEQDRLVPLKQGKDLYDLLGSQMKELAIIPGADHNNIMFVDSKSYMNAIENFILKQ
jgi:alpha-beta hydrolase superfamily lysophospholipase